MKLPDIDFKRWSHITVCAVGAVAVLIVFFKYILWITLPFALAWSVAFPVRQGASFISRRTKLSVKAASLILACLVIFGFFGTTFFLMKRLARELYTLLSYLSENPDIISNALYEVKAFFAGIMEKLPFLGSPGSEGLDRVEEYISAFTSDAVSAIAAALPRLIGNILIGLPGIVIFVIVTVVSIFYFCYDLTNINKKVLSLFPERIRSAFSTFKRGVFRTALKYLRSYLLIMLIIFAMLLVGFIVLRVDYALILAFVFAVIDLFPVLGVGAVLIPWGVFCILSGGSRLGIGLLILYAVIMVVRQWVEPKIIGSNFGLHPIITLFSMYSGIRLFGFLGMVIGPVAAVLIKGVLKNRSGITETEASRSHTRGKGTDT